MNELREITKKERDVADDYMDLMEIPALCEKYKDTKANIRRIIAFVSSRGYIPDADYNQLRKQKRHKEYSTYALKTSPKKAAEKFGVSIQTIRTAMDSVFPELVKFGQDRLLIQNYEDTKSLYEKKIIQIVERGGTLMECRKIHPNIKANSLKLIIVEIFGAMKYSTLKQGFNQDLRQKKLEREKEDKEGVVFQLIKNTVKPPSFWDKITHTAIRHKLNTEDYIKGRVVFLTQTIEVHYKETGEVLEKEWDSLQDILIEHLDEEAQDKISSWEVTKEAGLRVCFKCPNVYGYGVKKMGVLKFYKLYKK